MLKNYDRREIIKTLRYLRGRAKAGDLVHSFRAVHHLAKLSARVKNPAVANMTRTLSELYHLGNYREIAKVCEQYRQYWTIAGKLDAEERLRNYRVFPPRPLKFAQRGWIFAKNALRALRLGKILKF